MAESRILLLFCFLIFCLAGSNFIGGQKVSGISLRDQGGSVYSWCMYGVGAIKAAGTCLTSMRAQVARLLSHLPRLKSVAVLPEVQGYNSLISSMFGKLCTMYGQPSWVPQPVSEREQSKPHPPGLPTRTEAIVYVVLTWGFLDVITTQLLGILTGETPSEPGHTCACDQL